MVKKRITRRKGRKGLKRQNQQKGGGGASGDQERFNEWLAKVETFAANKKFTEISSYKDASLTLPSISTVADGFTVDGMDIRKRGTSAKFLLRDYLTLPLDDFQSKMKEFLSSGDFEIQEMAQYLGALENSLKSGSTLRSDPLYLLFLVMNLTSEDSKALYPQLIKVDFSQFDPFE